MSSHHPAQPELRHAETRTGTQAIGPNGSTGPGINGLTASFYDQQTGQRVDATPVTSEAAPAYAALQRTAGAALLSGPPARPGDWVVAQGAGPQAEVVIGADFLRRFAPADERAQQLLRWLDQTPGGAGAGDPSVAARLRLLRDSAIP